MKLLVLQHVNKRAGKPGTTGQMAGFLSPNDTVEVEDVVYGDVVDGNYLWYKCKDGFYYCSGAFFNINFQLNNRRLGDFSAGQQMDILQMVFQEAASILKKDVKDYVGCGIGNKNFDNAQELSLLVYVKEKVDIAELNVKVLPEIYYRGIRILTDVMEVGTFHHNAVISKRNLENSIPPPIGGGIKPHGKPGVGTRSLYVFKKNEDTIEHFLLTCYHVLLDDLFPLATYEGKWRHALFPVRDEQNEDDIYPVAKGEYSGTYDYAAVAISSSDVSENKVGDIVINDHVPFIELAALKDATVMAVGYISGLNEGKVLSVLNKVVVGKHDQEFNNVIITDKISEPGDSGAPVVDKKSKRLIGFIIGGNNQKSVVLPFYNLFLNRGFKIN
jgi:hypothetical protein